VHFNQDPVLGVTNNGMFEPITPASSLTGYGSVRRLLICRDHPAETVIDVSGKIRLGVEQLRKGQEDEKGCDANDSKYGKATM